ncbi:MAG: hypothetical protein HYT87_12915 [Nitrospirae bacterium]|nr:hypothetical protein [Nitrospirota bacterium]
MIPPHESDAKNGAGSAVSGGAINGGEASRDARRPVLYELLVEVESRLSSVFRRRGYLKPEDCAQKAAGVLVLIAQYGAGDALGGSLLMRFNPSNIPTLWVWLRGRKQGLVKDVPQSIDGMLKCLRWRTGDMEVDYVIEELEKLSASGGTYKVFETEGWGPLTEYLREHILGAFSWDEPLL